MALPASRQRQAGHMIVHDMRATFLADLAALMGCKLPIGGQLPDGRRPDVLCMDMARNVLFIGEAKHTETPGCLETQARLLAYLRWLAGHLCRPSAVGVFAICFGRSADQLGWQQTIDMLAHEAGIEFSQHGEERFGSGLLVTWFLAYGSDCSGVVT